MPQDPLVMMADTALRMLVLEGLRAAIWLAVWSLGLTVPFAAGWWVGRRMR